MLLHIAKVIFKILHNQPFIPLTTSRIQPILIPLCISNVSKLGNEFMKITILFYYVCVIQKINTNILEINRYG